jgi:hypothetical protein
MAMTICASNQLAWPDWLAAVAIAATDAAFQLSKAKGAGRYEADRRHMRRYRAAEYCLAKARRGSRKRTRREAFTEARDMICRGDPGATVESVKQSYNRIRRAISSGGADRYLAAEAGFPIRRDR